MICAPLLLLLAGVGLLAQTPVRPYGIVIHGGAGNITRARVTPEQEALVRKGLEAALAAGYAVLDKGGSSLDAVEAAVRVLEDDPVFNAGKGAVLTAEGHAELDAAIMDGKSQAAGSVAGLRRIKNPVSLARKVMEQSPYVMLVGPGAEAFAKTQGVALVDPKYFLTPERVARWKRASGQEPSPHGTVGAVALDQSGNLAAATSTGGMANKRWGRIGDAPLIGVGTYASNTTCAVSCTGWGEFFIRTVLAYDIAAQMAYKNTILDKAASIALQKVKNLGGDGGLVAMDREGHFTMRFNTPGMHRGYRLSDGSTATAMFGGE